MRHFLVIIISLVTVGVSAQTPIDTSFIVQYRLSLDTARHMPKPERAVAYWNAAKTYASLTKWDTAAKALDKSIKLQPIDTTIRNDANGLVVLSNIERNRNRTILAIVYAERAMSIAQQKQWSTDSLILLSTYLQELYTTVNNQTLIWRYKYFSDSIRWTTQNRLLVDSLATLHYGLSNATQTNHNLTTQLDTAHDENKKLTNYLWMLLAASALLFIGLLIALFTRKKTSSTKAIDSNSNEATTRSAVHDLVGLTDLMLQRGRTGDDLILLKGMERELQHLWKQTGTSDFPKAAVDEDRVMRSLKGIRILIFSDSADASFLLKSWLRKQIRICDIQSVESVDALPTSFQPQAIIYDTQIVSTDVLQRLSTSYVNIQVIISTAENNSSKDILQKPHALSLLLDRLMALYKPSEEKIVEPVNISINATETSTTIDANTLQYNCNLLEEAYAEKNGDKLELACQMLLPLFEQANSPATKWLKLLAEPPENISAVQIELAYRNVITYCRNASK